MIRFSRVPRRLTAAMALMLGISCTNPVCGCPPASAHALMSGRVTGPDGTPMPYSILTVQMSEAGCADPFWQAGYPRAEAEGRYSWAVHAGGESSVAGCIRAFASPPQHLTGLRASDTVAVPVQFSYEGTDVRMDFRLRAK